MIMSFLLMQGQKKKTTMIRLVLWSRIGGLISRLSLDVIDQRITVFPLTGSSLITICHVSPRGPKKSNLIIHKSLQENLKKINESVAEEDNESTLTIRSASE